jgi:hypothetical protein
MVYRSQLEALRTRVAELEDRLAKAQRDAEHVHSIEEELERTRRELRVAMRDPPRLGPRPQTRVFGAVVCGLLGGALLLTAWVVAAPTAWRAWKHARTIPYVPSDELCPSAAPPESCAPSYCNAKTQEASGELECDECLDNVRYDDAGRPDYAHSLGVTGCTKHYSPEWKRVCRGNGGSKSSTYVLWCRPAQ